MSLVNSPLLNFQQIVADNQIARYQAGEVSFEKLDVDYMARKLGRQGYLALMELKEEMSDKNQARYISNLYPRPKYNRYSNKKGDDLITYQDFMDKSIFWPNKEAFSESLTERVFDGLSKFQKRKHRNADFYFLSVDLNQDGENEFVVLDEYRNYRTAKFWFRCELASTNSCQGWRSNTISLSNRKIDGGSLQTLLEQGEVRTSAPKWQDLHIGELKLKVSGF